MLMADVRLSVTGAKPGIKRLDVAQVASMDTELQSTEFAPASQLVKMNLAQMKFLRKDLLIANQETIRKSKVGKAEIDQETQRNPDHLTAPKKRSLIHVRKAKVEITMEESGANSIVSGGRNTVSSATSFLANSQRSGVKKMKEKADGSPRSPVTMERARDQIATQNAQMRTKNIRAARRV
jgi:hypothetical protein